MDYTLNIYNNGTYICTLGANHVNYDNFIWWKLSELIKAYENQEISKENLDKAFETIGFFYVIDEDDAEKYATDYIDFAKKVISLPDVPLFDFDCVEDNTPIKVIKHNNQYFSLYEGDEQEYPMSNVEFEDMDLLFKKVVTFKEFDQIANFMMNIQDEHPENDTDFILNNTYVLRLNNI